MAVKTYFLPKIFALTLDSESARNLSSQESKIEVDGFKIPGFILSGSPEVLARFIAQAPVVKDNMEGIMEEAFKDLDFKGKEKRKRSFTLFTVNKKDDGSCCKILSIKPFVLIFPHDVGFVIGGREPVKKDFMKTLHELASWTGMKITLFSPESPTLRLFAKKQNELHVVLDSSPPGEVYKMESTKIFGLQLADRYEGVTHPGPALDYGMIVYDDDKHPIAQLVDGTIYMLVPIRSLDARSLIDEGGAGLLKKVLRAAWNAQIDGGLKPASTLPITDVSSYASFIKDRHIRALNEINDDIASVEAEMRTAETKYGACLVKKRELLATRRGFEDSLADKEKKDWTSEWEALRTLPNVRRINDVEGGLQAETELITAVYEGSKYPLGRFLIHISKVGQVSIRCLESRHPHLLPHPHIGETGKACFGNISMVLHKASLEYPAHAMHLVLRWLVEGYDPSLTKVLIEQWPKEVS